MPKQVMVVDNGTDPATWAQLLCDLGDDRFALYEKTVPTNYADARTLVLEAIAAKCAGEEYAQLPDVMIIDQVLYGRHRQGNDHAGLRLMRTVAKAIELANSELPLPRSILYTAEHRRDLAGAFVAAGGRAAVSRAHLNIGDRSSWADLLKRVCELPDGAALWPVKKPPVSNLNENQRAFLKLIAEGRGDRFIAEQLFELNERVDDEKVKKTKLNAVHQLRSSLREKGSEIMAAQRNARRVFDNVLPPELEDEFDKARSDQNSSLVDFFLPRLTEPIIVAPYDRAPHTLELGRTCPAEDCGQRMQADVVQVKLHQTSVIYTCPGCGGDPIQVNEAVLDTVAAGQHDDHF